MRTKVNPRRLSQRVSVPLAAVATLALPVTAGAGDVPGYTLTLIDLFDGDFANTAFAINNAGQVAGFSNAPTGHHAWRWTEGVLDDIGSVGGPFMHARDINELGQVVGFGNDDGGLWVGWRWDGGSMETIPSLGGDGSRAWGINDLSEVVGDAQIPSNFWNAILWTSGDPVNLGTLGGANSQAYAVNNSSQIAGFAVTPDIDARAVIWQGDEIIQLEQPPEYPDSVAYGVNEAGIAVGTVGVGDFVIVPATWGAEGLQILPHLGDDQAKSYVWTLNESGQAVGWTELGFADVVATTWIDGEVHDLNGLVNTTVDITLVQAWDINNEGRIVGMGLTETGPRAFLLIPLGAIPEDVNGDGVVNRLDVLAVVRAFGPCDGCPEDVNGDGVVDILDLWMVLRAWHGHPHPAPQSPETVGVADSGGES
jgi:probable HAF family extracellular repeat protein